MMMSNVALDEFVKFDAVDIFPHESSATIRKLNYPANHATLWENDVNIKTFVLFMSKENQTYFSLKKMNEKSEANMHSMIKGCQIFEKFSDNIRWKSVVHQYRLSPGDRLRVNTDARLGF